MGSYGHTYGDKVKPRFDAISVWKREGLSEKKIAENLGISYASFRTFKKQHSALLALLQENIPSDVDAKVENALLSLALGFKGEETISELKYNRETRKEELVISKKIDKKHKPDIAAAKFWLTNRKKKEWVENPHNNDIKKREIELREKEAESKAW